MKCRYYIVVVALLLFFAGDAQGQFSSGSVIMHSDPRLAVLLKKNPVAAPPPTRVPGTDASKKKNTTDKAASKEPTPTTASAPAPVASAEPTVEKHDAAPRETASTPHTNDKPRYIVVPAYKDSKVIYAGKGFRVQIYNGYDRDKAATVRTEFMRLYPGTRAYLSYAAPYFKVRVGDYRNRSDAMGMLKEANGMYATPCMIVPDQVTIHAN